MTRLALIVVSWYPHHIIQRGNSRERRICQPYGKYHPSSTITSRTLPETESIKIVSFSIVSSKMQKKWNLYKFPPSPRFYLSYSIRFYNFYQYCSVNFLIEKMNLLFYEFLQRALRFGDSFLDLHLNSRC